MRALSHTLSLVLFVAFVSTLTAETLVDDKFKSEKLPTRQLMRGPWKVADGMASCTQDDALYEKSKQHGPIIWYDVSFSEGTVKFAIKPHGSKTFVFTLNDEKGHDFRFVLTPEGLAVRAWPVQGHEEKAISLMTPKPGTPALKDDEWLEAELKFEGNHCTIKLGQFTQTFENDAIARVKTKLGFGFSFGTLAVKDVLVTKP